MLDGTRPDGNTLDGILQDATGPRTPRPILFLRALIANGVPARLGTDAFTLAMIVVEQQDRLFWRPVGFYRDQLCDLCGFPRSNPRRLRAARAALQSDNWLKIQAPKNGERAEVIYEMVLKGDDFDPGQNGPAKQLTASQNGSGDDLTRAKTVASPGPKRYSDPGQNGTPSIPSISIPISSIPNTPPNPLKGELFSSVSDEPKNEDAKARSSEAQVRAIYAAYPRKVKPLEAHKAITKALKQVGFDELLSLTTRYAAARTKPGQDPQFTPHPSTWFNQGRWGDDPAEWERLDDASSSTHGGFGGKATRNDPTRVRTGETARVMQAARLQAEQHFARAKAERRGPDNSASTYNPATCAPGVIGWDGTE